MNKIVIFTLNGCEYCEDLKQHLNNLKIEFVELEINEHSEVWDEVVNQTGYNLLPSIFISNEDTDDGPIFVPERDFKSREECLNIIQQYI
jgi:glutaredoxin